MNDTSETPKLVLIGRDGGRLWGRTTGERLRILFSRNGVDGTLTEEEAGDADGPVIVVRADAVLDPPLVAALVSRPGLILIADDGTTPVAAHAPAGEAAAALKSIRTGRPVPPLQARRPKDLGVNFWKKLRKRETPYAMILRDDNRAEVEWRSFMGTYKGATDLVTKRVWPRPAFHVTRWLADTFVTPNMVTTLSAVFVVLAFWLFLQGHYGWGLVCAWFMTFLDTVDGKLARTTLKTSTWGDIFDHGIDLIHPPFWYVAWGLGLERAGHPLDGTVWWWTIGVIVAGYVLQRVIEGMAIKWLGLEIHIWRRIDTFFREITARRNPNLVILTVFTLFGRPDLGLVAVAVWTGICLLLHAVQIVQAFAEKRRSGGLVSWMTRGEGT